MIKINRRKVGICILFSLLTFGIYMIYWKYLTIKNIKSIQGKEGKCAGELLCLVFIPFYSLFWWYTRGKTVKIMFNKSGFSVLGNEIIYLIFDFIGLSIVSLSIMQNDFNLLPADQVVFVDKPSKGVQVFSKVIIVIALICASLLLITAIFLGIYSYRVRTTGKLIPIFGYLPLYKLSANMDPPTSEDFEKLYPIDMTFNGKVKEGLRAETEQITLERTDDLKKIKVRIGEKTEITKKIKQGDFIIMRVVKAENVHIGDVISFFDPEAGGTAIVTHRVIALEYDEKTGALVSFRTRGDNNNVADLVSIPVENLVGVWTGISFKGIGEKFLQSTYIVSGTF